MEVTYTKGEGAGQMYVYKDTSSALPEIFVGNELGSGVAISNQYGSISPVSVGFVNYGTGSATFTIKAYYKSNAPAGNAGKSA